MRLVFGQDGAVANWTERQLGMVIHPPYVAIGVVDKDGVPRGSVLFNDWNGSNLEIHIYGPGAVQRGIIRAVYHYVFVQCRANRLTAKTKRSNVIMRKLLPRFGFTFEATLKQYYGPRRENDALVFRLEPDAAQKWM